MTRDTRTNTGGEYTPEVTKAREEEKERKKKQLFRRNQRKNEAKKERPPTLASHSFN